MEGTPPDAEMTEGRPPRAAARRYARPSRRKVLLSPPSGDDEEDAARGGPQKRSPRGEKARVYARCRCVHCMRRPLQPPPAASHAAARRHLACSHPVFTRWMTRPRPAVLRPPAAALHHMDNAGGRSRKAGECAWLPAPPRPGTRVGGSGGGSARAAGRGGRAYPTGAAFWSGSTAAACSMVGGRGRVRGGGAVPRAVLP